MGRFDTSVFYTLANGKRIHLLVSREIKHYIEQTKRQYQTQSRKSRLYDTELTIDLIDTKASFLRDGFIDLIHEVERYNRLYNAINKLPETQQRRLKMYYFERFTYSQIAEIEGVAVNAIVEAIERAKITLRAKMLK